MFSFLTHKNVDPTQALKGALHGFQLPSFPAADLEILRLLRDKDSSAGSIAAAVEVDPNLCVKVISLANSAAFSPAHDIGSVAQAVALIGLTQMESLVMSAAVGKTMPREQRRGFEFSRFWSTAVLRAVLARAVAEKLCPGRSAVSFTAGFLQDLAIPFLAQQNPEDYGAVLERWHAGEGRLSDLERNAFDWDHAEVGTWICFDWKFPENIASAIGGHHTPDDDVFDCPLPVALVAHITETDSEAGIEKISQILRDECQMDGAEIDALIASSLTTADELKRFLT